MSLLKESSLSFNLDLKSGLDSISIPDGGPSKLDSEFAFAKCGFRSFIVK